MAESSRLPAGARTASTCSAAAARGTHVFKIADYSLHKGMGSRNFIRSAAFAVGGYDWCVRYYPDGRGEPAVYLELLTKNAKVRAHFDFTLVAQVTGQMPLFVTLAHPGVFNSMEAASESVMGGGLLSPSELEKEDSRYLRSDCLVIKCDVTILSEPQVVSVAPEIQAPPPSTFLNNLGKLLETGEGADVSFEVKGEVFPAHKIILAMQSPVFKAELYGPMRNTSIDQNIVAVEDMQPDVFKALLAYTYTDSLPSMDGLEGGDKEEMVKHLLVAADRYGVERMKLMCENILCDSLNVERVASTLALADQHHCSSLKAACIEFINSSSDRMDDVVATQGYKDLKRSCPAMLVDVLERANKSRKF